MHFFPNKIKANGCIFQAVIQRLFGSIDKPGTGAQKNQETRPFFPAGWAHIRVRVSSELDCGGPGQQAASLPPLQADGLMPSLVPLHFLPQSPVCFQESAGRGCYKLAEQGWTPGPPEGSAAPAEAVGCRCQLTSNTPRPQDSQRAFDGSQAVPSHTPPTSRRVEQSGASSFSQTETTAFWPQTGWDQS